MIGAACAVLFRGGPATPLIRQKTGPSMPLAQWSRSQSPERSRTVPDVLTPERDLLNIRPRFFSAGHAGLALALFSSSAAQAQITQLDTVQVTATRSEEKVDSVPASVSVVTDEQMRARGAHDLRSALALVSGVEITPGGDGGPAGSVPAFWGLREFDAFLLVVDGVPYGGAFNPQLTTLSMDNVERIEVLRGAAPVMYGATSSVGVIHVIHYPPGKTPRRASIGIGTRNSASASVSADI